MNNGRTWETFPGEPKTFAYDIETGAVFNKKNISVPLFYIALEKIPNVLFPIRARENECFVYITFAGEEGNIWKCIENAELGGIRRE